MKLLANIVVYCLMIPIFIVSLPVVLVLLLLRGLAIGALMFYDIVSGVPKDEVMEKWKIR